MARHPMWDYHTTAQRRLMNQQLHKLYLFQEHMVLALQASIPVQGPQVLEPEQLAEELTEALVLVL